MMISNHGIVRMNDDGMICFITFDLSSLGFTFETIYNDTLDTVCDMVSCSTTINTESTDIITTTTDI